MEKVITKKSQMNEKLKLESKVYNKANCDVKIAKKNSVFLAKKTYMYCTFHNKIGSQINVLF